MIRSSAVRPGGAFLFRTTLASVSWPTTSRPSLIQARRRSSSRNPADASTAAEICSERPGGRRTISWTSARRAMAASRRIRSPSWAVVAFRPFAGWAGV